MTDEVIAQVHAAKEAFAAEHGYDLKRMVDALRLTELELRKAGVVFETGPSAEDPQPARTGPTARANRA
jgi:hypothetical protein